MRVEAATFLAASPDEAWRVLLRWELQPRWMHDADSVRVLTTYREGKGVRIAVRTRVLGVPLFTEVLEVTAWDPPRSLALAHRGFVRGSGEWLLEPTAHGTRLRWREEISLPVPVLGELALRAYRPFMRWLMRRSLANLASMLERSA
jgi:carbon monoxide dehydrogenase subunit G